MSWGGAALLLVALALSGPLAAAETKSLKQVEAELAAKKSAAAAAAKAAQAAQDAVQKLQQQLRDATRAEQQRDDALDALEAQLGQLERKERGKIAQLRQSERGQDETLRLLLRLARQPPALWLLQDGTTVDQARRASLLRGVYDAYRVRAATIAADLADVRAVQEQIAAKRLATDAARRDLAAQQDALEQLIAVRKRAAEARRAEHQTLTAAMKDLAAQAKDLRGLLDQVAARGHKPVKGPKAGRLREDLTMPVVGAIARGFGEKDRDGVVSRGVTVKGKAGARVVAPQAGKVMFAGPFKGYGDIVILQHRNGDHSLLAGFGRIDIAVGETVTAGEPVGVLAAGGDGLYFELRRDGNPINPLAARRG